MTGVNKGDVSKVLKLHQQDRTRTSGFKLDKFRFRKEIGRNWFGSRIVDEWNKLPNGVVSTGTIQTFKSRLDKYTDSEGWLWYRHGKIVLNRRCLAWANRPSAEALFLCSYFLCNNSSPMFLALEHCSYPEFLELQ